MTNTITKVMPQNIPLTFLQFLHHSTLSICSLIGRNYFNYSIGHKPSRVSCTPEHLTSSAWRSLWWLHLLLPLLLRGSMGLRHARHFGILQSGGQILAQLEKMPFCDSSQRSGGRHPISPLRLSLTPPLPQMTPLMEVGWIWPDEECGDLWRLRLRVSFKWEFRFEIIPSLFL